MRHAPGCVWWLAPFEGFWSHKPRTPRGCAALASFAACPRLRMVVGSL
nr:MAG TPA: hypothetical protein [Caudoviricetes sp.]